MTSEKIKIFSYYPEYLQGGRFDEDEAIGESSDNRSWRKEFGEWHISNAGGESSDFDNNNLELHQVEELFSEDVCGEKRVLLKFQPTSHIYPTFVDKDRNIFATYKDSILDDELICAACGNKIHGKEAWYDEITPVADGGEVLHLDCVKIVEMSKQ